MRILTVNTGSSSVRLAFFEYANRSAPIKRFSARYEFEKGDEPGAMLHRFLEQHSLANVDAVVHRVVHGGERLVRPCLIDADVEAEITRLAPLAPLHNLRALAWIEACRVCLGDAVAQVAAFDTAFFAELPEPARRYAVPRALTHKHGLRRYGFHGLAHEAMWRRWRAVRPDVDRGGRVISFQLGAGCSVAAIAHGAARDTSMGFSPLEGLVMATRPGDLDPGLLIYLQRAEQLSPAAMEQLLNRECGLAGIAGEPDMQRLLARGDADAKLALDMYCHRARKYLGAYLAVLGGADAVLFGGGVGEHAPYVRAKILENMQWAGIVLNAQHNDEAVGTESRISNQNSNVDVWVMPVEEAAILADAALTVLTPLLARSNA